MNKFRIFNRNYNFVTEISILPFFQKLEFLGSYKNNVKNYFPFLNTSQKSPLRHGSSGKMMEEPESNPYNNM